VGRSGRWVKMRTRTSAGRERRLAGAAGAGCTKPAAGMQVAESSGAGVLGRGGRRSGR
jgi:hypothetical protein